MTTVWEGSYSETTGPYYFFLKVGQGNKLLAKANETGLMWIGFDFDDEIRSRIPLIERNPTAERWPQRIDRSLTDLYYLAAATSQYMRTRCRAVTFTATDLQVWRITSALQDMTEDAARRLQVTFNKREKFLSAEKLLQIRRSELLGSIDSLAVYQYLNRGTFRPIFRCYPDAFADTSRNRWLFDVPKLMPFWGLEETNYGAWVRLYLNSLTGEATWPAVPALSDEQIRELIPFIVSPAQLETAATHFAADLGFTVDIGAGKGLDKVDVKASVRHKKRTRNDLVRFALDLCTRHRIMLGDRVTSNLWNSYTLSIQCKNYAGHPNLTEPGILLFASHGERADIDGMVTLQQILENPRDDFGRLNDWVTLMTSYISRCE